MKDPRLQQFAKQLVTYSCAVQPGEKVLVEDRGIAPEFTAALVEEIYAAQAIPVVLLYNLEVERALMMGYTQEQLEWMAKLDAQRMADCQAYIGIRGGHNAFETSDVPQRRKPCTASTTANLCTAISGCPTPSGWCCATPPLPLPSRQA